MSNFMGLNSINNTTVSDTSMANFILDWWKRPLFLKADQWTNNSYDWSWFDPSARLYRQSVCQRVHPFAAIVHF